MLTVGACFLPPALISPFFEVLEHFLSLSAPKLAIYYRLQTPLKQELLLYPLGCYTKDICGMEMKIADRPVMIPPGENKRFPVAGDAPKPTKAITCFLTLIPVHCFIPHLISVHQTPLATSWFLLSHQHNDVGQEWAWLSRDDPPIMAKEAAVPRWVQLVHSTCLHLFVLCKLNAILREFPSQGLSVLSHPLTSDGATATH